MLQTCKARWVWAPVCPKCGWALCSYGSCDPSPTKIMGYKLAFQDCRAFRWSPFIWIRGKHLRLPVPETKASVTKGRPSKHWPFFFKKKELVCLYVSPTPGSRFANVPFANVSFCSSKKRNERCAWICFVLSVTIQKSGIRMYILRSLSHWSGETVRELTQHLRETTSEVGEQDVGEATRRRNDR